MIKCFLFSGLIFLSAACGNQQKEQDCSRYRTGHFKWHAQTPNGLRRYILERNDSIQLETDINSGMVTTMKIKWISPCRYELAYIKSNRYMPDSVIQFRKAHNVITTIVPGTHDYYLFESKADGFDHILK